LLAACLLGFFGGFCESSLGAASAGSLEPKLVTPPGVLLREVAYTGEQGSAFVADTAVLLSCQNCGPAWHYFATASGKALYVFGADSARKTACDNACRQGFSPFLGRKGSAAIGDWTVIGRGTEQPQWAYQGQAVYTYDGEDPDPARSGAKQTPEQILNPASEAYSPKKGWRRAAFLPEKTIAVPAGIALKNVLSANGYVFLNKSTGTLLYVAKSPPKNPAMWSAMYAPGLAHAVGDFSIVKREDGLGQWAYKGEPLYSYAGDYVFDDLNGTIAGEAVEPAMAFRHFMPGDARIEVLPYRGPLLSTSGGMTLYVQRAGRARLDSDKRGKYTVPVASAEALGTHGCQNECLETWRPFVARADDQPSGLWTIYDRPDGSRQWAYRGSALYTFSGDHQPGDIAGNNQLVLVVGRPDDANADLYKVAAGSGGPPGAGFTWHTVALVD
jgi:predicted lipoprotein with Yx(FWY)xxD motif